MNVLILSTQCGDWEALYVNSELITQGHSIGEGDRNYLWRKGIELGFTPDDIYYKELNDEDEEETMMSGNMPNDISKYLVS